MLLHLDGQENLARDPVTPDIPTNPEGAFPCGSVSAPLFLPALDPLRAP